MDITVMIIIVATIVSIVFFRNKAGLIISYTISGLIGLYGVGTIVTTLIDPHRLSELSYLIGGICILFASGIFLLARKLYKNKLKKSIATEK